MSQEIADRANRFETFVAWYLRFNGYFTVPSFVIHPGDDPTRISGDTIGNLTEVDTIAIRLPHSREASGVQFPVDPKLVDEGSKDRFDVIIAEAKSGTSDSPNTVWRKHETVHIEYLLRFLGWHKEDSQIASVAKKLADEYIFEEPKPGIRVRYIVFARQPDKHWRTKGVTYVTFGDCIKFLAEDRGQCWQTAGIGRRSMHDQWNPLIKRIFEIANDASFDPSRRQKDILKILEDGQTG